jgi:dienelactone hydrolase
MRPSFAALLLVAGCSAELASDRAVLTGPEPRLRVRKVSEGNDFTPVADRSLWERRVRFLREQQLVASGLWPAPDRCPLNPVVTRTIDRGDYVIENLYFASLPGFYVTGSLFRPKGPGRFPGVLCTHGHDRKGRFQDTGEKTRDGKPNPDRFPYQARCITLARLGCAALLYDMVGYADAKQMRHPADMTAARPPEGTDDLEGLDCEQFLLSTMGLQTWNSIRAVDYLISRPDVDADRIAVTGESGGATQTLMLMMTEPRLAAAAPVCMVSPGFQGDCTCEQAALGKIGTDTVEFCAAFAPKPLIVVTATGDWTKDLVEKGGPEIRSAYEAKGAGDRIRIVRFQAPHNYNRTSREAVYAAFNDWLRLGHPAPPVEPPFEPLDAKELAVFDETHPRPADALDAKSLKALLLRSAETGAKSLSVPELRAALRHLVASDLPPPHSVRTASREETGGAVALRLLRPEGSDVAADLFTPAGPSGAAAVVLGSRKDVTDALLARGITVLAVRPFRRAERPSSLGFFPCFNRTALAERVHDALGAIAWLKDQPGIARVDLLGCGPEGTTALLARALSGDAIARTCAEDAGFSFRSIRSPDDDRFLPGALRYGDVAGLAALAAPGDLLLTEARGLDAAPLQAAYGTSGRLRVEDGSLSAASMAEWLARRP